MEERRAGVIIVIIALAAVVGWVTFGQSGVEYRARPDTNPTAASISSGYDEYDRVLDQLSADLEQANRNAGTRLSGKRYLETDARQCEVLDYVCSVGERKFADPYGCGCMPDERLASSTDDGVAATSTDPELGREVGFGEEFRLRLGEEVAISGGGDVLWIDAFQETDTVPEVIYKIYIAAEDKAYNYPEQQDTVLYVIEEVASDYETYVDLIIANRLTTPSSDDDGAQEG